jgi:uncharacterized protein YbjT (DUF2867 family)
MCILLAGATGVIGRQAVPVLAAAGHEVVGLARTPARLPDAEVLAADALDRAAVQRAVLAAGPDVIVHMLTAIPDPVDPRHLARDMALTNRLRTQGTANLLAAAGGARVIVQGVAYAYDPAGPPVKDEDAPLWHHPPAQFAPGGRRRGGAGPPCHLGRGAGAAAGPPLRAGLWLRPRRRRPHPAAPRRQAPADRRRALAVLLHPRPRRGHGDLGRRHVPAWLARLVVGGWGVAYMTGLAGASNLRVREKLDWKPTYTNWRAGLSADLDTH